MYIDGVFSGGGIKGYALIGALQALEERGYALKNMAGTSAGAIISAMIIAGYKGQELEEIMMSIRLEELLDRRIGYSLPFMKWLRLYWRLGLFKGDRMEHQISELLLQKGISTFRDIPPMSLRIIASDISNGHMIVLPDDLYKYGVDPERFSVAKAIRMSCSVPYFFEPVRLSDKIIVDGGVLSNFPMWLFDRENVKKKRPVIGVRLNGVNGFPPREITNAVSLFSSLFTTMRVAHDNRYISRKHEKNIVFIPTDETNFLEFDLSDAKKKELILLGKSSTSAFLGRWQH